MAQGTAARLVSSSDSSRFCDWRWYSKMVLRKNFMRTMRMKRGIMCWLTYIMPS